MQIKPKYSIEEIFQIWGHCDKTVLIKFNPTSIAYKKYGKSITGNFFYENINDESFKDLLLSKDKNDGFLKFVPTRTSQISEEQRRNLKNEGFKASDIFNILSC